MSENQGRTQTAMEGEATTMVEPPPPGAAAPPLDAARFRRAPLGLRTWALAGAALLAVLVPALATLDLALPGRPALAVGYVLLVPGVPLALALRLPNALLTTALAIASSLAVTVLYGTLTIVGGWWSPVGGAWAVTLVALLLSVLAARPAVPQRQAGPGRPADPAVNASSGRRASSATAVGPQRPAGAAVALLPRLVVPALLVLTGLVWWWSTRHVRLDEAATLGLLPVAGWRYLLALVMVCALTAYALLHHRLQHALLTGCAVLVALVGYGTVPVADRAGSVPVGWVHVAFAQYISERGTVPTGVDARFSWPGFFSATGQLVALAGTPDSRSFLVLASVVYTLAALPALLLIARAITRSWRWSWVAVFVYLFTNWYQQDYFSPQATAFVIYTTVLATLLWLVSDAGAPRLEGSWASRARQAFTRVPALPPGVPPRTAVVLGLVLALLVTAVVLGHQLTPLTLIFALVVFTLTGQTRYRLLWFFMAVVFAAWFSYGATDYWFGHLDTVFGDLGQVSNSVGAGVANRLVGDPTYQSAQYVRIGWSLLLFLGAALGGLLLGRRPDRLLIAGLACAPFGLLAVQSYGGEGVIRSFLYASPLLAPLCAVSLRALVTRLATRSGGGRTRTGSPVDGGRSWGLTAAVAVSLVLAALVLTFTRGLNASFERTPPDQVRASETLRDLVRPGDRVALPTTVGLTPPLPLTETPVDYLDLEACDSGDLDGCLGEERPAFVLLTLTQERYGELLESRPDGWVWRLGDQLGASGEYRRVFAAPDAWLLQSTTGGAS